MIERNIGVGQEAWIQRFSLFFQNKSTSTPAVFLLTALLNISIVEFLFISRYFGIGSDFSYFLRLKLPLLDIKIREKRMKGKRFGHIWGPSSLP